MGSPMPGGAEQEPSGKMPLHPCISTLGHAKCPLHRRVSYTITKHFNQQQRISFTASLSTVSRCFFPGKQSTGEVCTALHLTTLCPVANIQNKVPAPGESFLGPHAPCMPEIRPRGWCHSWHTLMAASSQLSGPHKQDAGRQHWSGAQEG